MNITDSEKEFVDACTKVGELVGMLLVLKITTASSHDANPIEKDKLLTRKEAAGRMKVSVSTFDGWRRQGVVKPVEGLGVRTVRYRESDLDRLVARRRK